MRAWRGLLVGLVVASMAAGGTIASAQKEPGKEADLFKNLGLSNDQKSKLDTLTSERKTAMTSGSKKISEIRQRLVGLLSDKKASDKEIDKAADLLAKTDREMLLTEIKFHKAMRQLLTQEQLTTLSKGGK